MQDADEHEQQLLSRAAWLYFHEDLTQAEIGERLGVTRLKVNRLLQMGRESGLISVSINTPFRECVDLEGRLVRRFGLIRAIVAPTPEHGGERLYEAIGRPAGEYVSRALRDGQSLGVGWGRTMREAINGIAVRAYRDISISSLYGGVPRSPVNPFDSTAMFARRFQARTCNHLAAPMFVSSPQVRDTIAGQDLFRTFYEEALQVDMILTASGDLTSQATNLALGVITPDQRASLARAGAVGEFFGRFLDDKGDPVDHPLNACSMSPDFTGLLRAPHIVLVSGGLAKLNILHAILGRGYVHVFVTDAETAQNLLNR
ncbi:Deoxyribonucleoside regulator [Fundidesulfovibrio magnetotacticus]|uniref:Deoxyribonucleoside regulator n=1 Tax=Fundidesulfovibrio magnetotacticus TaxID=2730080 RepID=A0A6V8LQA8_9BACT|nr:sugar-binding transcriptional regulator [Fundidesulfovibrio magnetotacticus]GFK92518.1 Deoxyribonucleoside regulator [Fundidesulfovibrio magnetotacticus]